MPHSGVEGEHQWNYYQGVKAPSHPEGFEVRWPGVPSVELLCVYNALFRSVLEYSYVIWATSLPRYIVDQIERIKKRAMRILFPDLKYQQALNTG